MSTDTDVTSILSRPAASIEPPKNAPPGWYQCRVLDVDTSFRRPTKSGNKQVIFSIGLEAPIEVDTAALTGFDFPHKMSMFQVLTDASAYRMKEFLEKALQIDMQNITLGEALGQARGRMFRGHVVHDLSREKPFASIDETAPID